MSDTETEVQEPQPDTADAPDEQQEPSEQPAGPAEQPTEDPGQEPVEEPTPGEGDGTETPVAPDEGDQGQDEGQSPDEQEPQTVSLSEKDLEKIQDKLDRENERHTKRIGEIMEDGATDLLPCPTCSHFIAGWLYDPRLAPLPDEAVANTRALLGIEDTAEFQHDPTTETCPVCGGFGDVVTGSKRPGYELRQCSRCSQTGYVSKTQPTNGNGHAEPAPAESGPTVYGLDVSEDPEVRHLRERGFVVIPPTPVPAVAS